MERVIDLVTETTAGKGKGLTIVLTHHLFSQRSWQNELQVRFPGASRRASLAQAGPRAPCLKRISNRSQKLAFKIHLFDYLAQPVGYES